MKTQFIRISIIIFYLLSLQSCLFSNCNEIDLSKDDRSWIEGYEKIETLIFISDLNNVDTFLLEEKYEDYTTCSKFELGPDVYNYVGVSFLKKGTPNELKNKIGINIEKDFQHNADSECIKSFYVLDLNASFDSTSNMELNIEYIDLPSLSADSIKTYFFKLGDSFSDNRSNKILSFNWSKQFGLIKYELKTGESYYLKSKN